MLNSSLTEIMFGSWVTSMFTDFHRLCVCYISSVICFLEGCQSSLFYDDDENCNKNVIYSDVMFSIMKRLLYAERILMYALLYGRKKIVVKNNWLKKTHDRNIKCSLSFEYNKQQNKLVKPYLNICNVTVVSSHKKWPSTFNVYCLLSCGEHTMFIWHPELCLPSCQVWI